MHALSCVVLLAIIASASHGGSSVLYVDDDAAPNGDGQTWETAFRFLRYLASLSSRWL